MSIVNLSTYHNNSMDDIREQMAIRRGELPEEEVEDDSSYLASVLDIDPDEIDADQMQMLMKCHRAEQAGDAAIYQALFNGTYVKDISSNQWYMYQDPYWVHDAKKQSVVSCNQIIKMYQILFDYYYYSGKYNKEYLEHLSKSINDNIKNLQTLTYQEKVLEMAAIGNNGLGITGDQWDNHPNLICHENTILDLKTLKTVKSDPSLYLRAHTTTTRDNYPKEPTKFLKALEDIFAFTEPEPVRENYFQQALANEKESDIILKYKGDCDLWEQKNATYTQEIISYLQVLLGYSIIGEVTEHIMVIFWGKGRNGKTLLIEILNKVLDGYACAVEPELLLSSHHGSASGSASPDILNLQGKRFISASETNENAFFDSSKVKRLVGGDTLTGRGLYANNYTSFTPSHTLFLLTNSKPNASSDDYALWKRMTLIPFLVSFVDNPDPAKLNEKKININLGHEIDQERPEILNWLVHGAYRYYQEGLKTPDCIAKGTEEYRREQDTMGSFIEECCLVHQDASCRAQDIYEIYQLWSTRSGYRPKNLKNFGTTLKELFERKRTNRGNTYKGVQINDTWCTELRG